MTPQAQIQSLMTNNFDCLFSLKASRPLAFVAGMKSHLQRLMVTAVVLHKHHRLGLVFLFLPYNFSTVSLPHSAALGAERYHPNNSILNNG